MRLAAILLLTVSVAAGQNIGTKPLAVGSTIKISLSPQLTTTLLFPGPLAGTFGLGLISGNNAQAQRDGAGVQVEHPDGSNVLVLHALSESSRVLMTVLLEGQLYVFDVASGPSPDVAVTLVKADAAALLRKLYPDLYQGYNARQADYTSDSGVVKTTVTQVHRFSKEDAIVLEGTVQNETNHPISFDGRATTVQVANEVHPAKLTDCLRPIPAGATVPIDVVIQGDIDGGRANLSIDNEFRIILPPIPGEGTVWNFKNGRSGEKFKVTPPADKGPVPLTQTGKPAKEGQQP
jgi:hypothetical protein